MRREIKATALWLVLAFSLTFAGFRQAKVVTAREAKARTENLPPPAKTKAAIRPPPEVFTGNAVEDYIARCDKGLNDREIGWILEDFRNAGLDHPPAAESAATDVLIDHHRRQNRWYRDALADGLRLTPAQSAEVDGNLGRMLEKFSHLFMGVATNEEKEEMREMTEEHITGMFRQWISTGQGISPRGLFTATRAQQDILDNSFNRDPLPDPFEENAPPPPAPPPVDPSQPTLKGKTAATYPIEEDYPIPTGLEAADRGFPILKSQQMVLSIPSDTLIRRKDPDTPERFMGNVRRLHPAQLKMLLLESPEAAEKIQRGLDANPR